MSGSQKGDFTFQLASDIEHDRVYVEIFYREKFLALISQEKGENEEVIEFPCTGLVETKICRHVDLASFTWAIKTGLRLLRDQS